MPIVADFLIGVGCFFLWSAQGRHDERSGKSRAEDLFIQFGCPRPVMIVPLYSLLTLPILVRFSSSRLHLCLFLGTGDKACSACSRVDPFVPAPLMLVITTHATAARKSYEGCAACLNIRGLIFNVKSHTSSHVNGSGSLDGRSTQ